MQTPPLPPLKNGQIGFLVQKMHNILKRIQKQFSDFSGFPKLSFKVSGTKICDEKFSFATISLATISKCVSKHSKKTKKKCQQIILFINIFFIKIEAKKMFGKNNVFC